MLLFIVKAFFFLVLRFSRYWNPKVYYRVQESHSKSQKIVILCINPCVRQEMETNCKRMQTVGTYVSFYVEVLRIETHPLLRHFFNLFFLAYLVL